MNNLVRLYKEEYITVMKKIQYALFVRILTNENGEKIKPVFA